MIAEIAALTLAVAVQQGPVGQPATEIWWRREWVLERNRHRRAGDWEWERIHPRDEFICDDRPRENRRRCGLER